jgi:hypothetical protein
MTATTCSLEHIARIVADELTRKGDAWRPNSHAYSPHLVALGESLAAALEPDSPSSSYSSVPSFQCLEPFLRPDVLRFAKLMSSMMDAKEQEKGPINGNYPIHKALMNLEAQWNKMREFPTPQGDALRRLLIHLANFAMIAEGKIG